ncbi:glycosyltransferase family 2 protein [Streptomyces sp. NPDC004609]|uniref:glycosyltransferase family 2 protein n=1 Tax=Streptomyces sp. NPDC004609 TaxID=3364704 RepID=UPI0036966C27
MSRYIARVKLSVIVPFYNVQTYAPDALRSLQANTRDDFEFILVDDCSTDATPEILERGARDIPGARLIRHERNGGIAKARNTGIDASEGEYLAFLDGDDWTAPGHFERLLTATERLGCDFVRNDHVQSTGSARTIHRVPVARRGEVLRPRDAILPANRSTSVDYPFPCAGLYHRRLVDRGLLHFQEELRTAEDRLWIWRLHRKAESFAAISELGIFYRRGIPTSLTQVGDGRQLDFAVAYDLILKETAEDPDAAQLLPKVVRTYCAMISHHLARVENLEPAVARKLRSTSAAALKRMPQDVLREVLAGMDSERATRLRRLRRRPSAGGSTGPTGEVAA